MNEDKIIKKLEDHDKKFAENGRRFDEHDKRFDEVDKKLIKIDKRFDEVDKQFDRVIAKIVEHDDWLDRIEENMATKQDIRDIHDTLDKLVHLAEKKDQELTFMGERVKRIETAVGLT